MKCDNSNCKCCNPDDICGCRPIFGKHLDEVYVCKEHGMSWTWERIPSYARKFIPSSITAFWVGRVIQ